MISGISFIIQFIFDPSLFMTLFASILAIISVIYVVFNFPISKTAKFPKAQSQLAKCQAYIEVTVYVLIFLCFCVGMPRTRLPFDVTLFHYILCLQFVPLISLFWSYKRYPLIFDSTFVTARQSKIISYLTVIAAIALTALYAASQPSCEAVGGWTMWILGIACAAYAIWNILLPIRISVKCYLNHLGGMVLWALVVIDWLGSIPLNLDAGKWYVAGMGGLFILAYMLQAKHFSSEPIPAKSE